MTTNPTEWNAPSYHRVANPHVGWGQRVLDSLALRGDEVAIDAGCGTGRVTAELLDRLPQGRVIAIDRSANMLEQAEASLAPVYGDRVRYLQADLLDLTPDLVGEPVDLIFSTATFHWVLDHERLFRTLLPLLEPGGWLVAQCGGGPNLAAVKTRAEAAMHREPYARWFAGWQGPWLYADAPTTARRLADAGFTNIETEVIEAPTVLGGRDEYREFLKTVIFRTHLARIPDVALQEALLDELVEQSAALETPWSLDYWRLNLRGERPVETA